MTALLLLSDTHVPKRAKDLPAELWNAIEAAEVVIHAGDWVSVEFLDLLESRSRRLIGVRGNNDVDAAFRDRLPEVARLELDGVRIAVVHETGQATGRERRAHATHPDTDLLVFGHSHIPWDSVAPSGMRLLNPGSPTDRRRQPTGTFLTATTRDGAVQEVVLHRIHPADASG